MLPRCRLLDIFIHQEKSGSNNKKQTKLNLHGYFYILFRVGVTKWLAVDATRDKGFWCATSLKLNHCGCTDANKNYSDVRVYRLQTDDI